MSNRRFYSPFVRSIAMVLCFVCFVVILTYVFIPYESRALRERSDMGRLREIGFAVEGYAKDHDGTMPPTYIADGNGNAILSWRVLILPYLNQRMGKGVDLYKKIALDEPWNSEHNKALAKLMPDVFRSRFFPRDTETPFLAVVGPRSVWRHDGSIQFESAKQAKAKLVARFESHQVPWMAPVDISADALYKEILSSPVKSDDFIMFCSADRSDGRLYPMDKEVIAGRVRSSFEINSERLYTEEESVAPTD